MPGAQPPADPVGAVGWWWPLAALVAIYLAAKVFFSFDIGLLLLVGGVLALGAYAALLIEDGRAH